MRIKVDPSCITPLTSPLSRMGFPNKPVESEFDSGLGKDTPYEGCMVCVYEVWGSIPQPHSTKQFLSKFGSPDRGSYTPRSPTSMIQLLSITEIPITSRQNLERGRKRESREPRVPGSSIHHKLLESPHKVQCGRDPGVKGACVP